MINKEYLHRDLKLENILIHQKTLKLADFGFASKADYSGNKLLKECVGTPLYMAPQLLENKYYSVKSDIWSIGVLAYRMITGQFPWDGSTTKELLRAIKTQ
jgi:serine/threonine protein kinase